MGDRNNESALSTQESSPVIRAGEKRKAEEVRKQPEELEMSGIEKRRHICSDILSVNSNLGKSNLEDDYVVNVDQDEQLFRGNEKMEAIENAQCSEQEVNDTDSECLCSSGRIDPTTEIINLRRENKLLKEKEEIHKRIIEDMQLQIQKLENLVSGQTFQMLQPLVLPIVCRYLDLKTLLVCRLVCHKWRDGVECFLENCFSHGSVQRHLNFNTQLQDQNQQKLLSVNTTELKKLENRYVLTKSTVLEQFLQKMKDVKNNPFLGRAELEANFEYNSINMQNLTVQTLFVQPCANMKNTEELTTEPFYSKLFSYIPNIKSLYIKEEPTLPELIPWNGGIDPCLTYPLAKHNTAESLYSSEIWDLLKFLKGVTMEVETRAFGKQETIVRTRTCTRKGFQTFKNHSQE